MSDEAKSGARRAAIFAVSVPIPMQEVSVAQNSAAAVRSVPAGEQQVPVAAADRSGAAASTVDSKIAGLSTFAPSADIGLDLSGGIAPEISGNEPVQPSCREASKIDEESGFRSSGVVIPVNGSADDTPEEPKAETVSQINADVLDSKVPDGVVAKEPATPMPLPEHNVNIDAPAVAAIDGTVELSQAGIKAASVGQIEPKPTEKTKISSAQPAKSNRASGEVAAEPSPEIPAGPDFARSGTTSKSSAKAAQSKNGSVNQTAVKEPQKNKAVAHITPAAELSIDGSSVASTVQRTEINRVDVPTQHSIPEASPSAASITPTEARSVADPPTGQKAEAEVRAADPGARDLPSIGPVREAHILNRPEQSEMRIGLQTSAFGNVEVHAVVRESQVGLTIGSERGDLRHVLTNEVPAIAGRLQQHDLRLDAVRFLDQGPSFDAGSSAADPRGRSFNYSRTNTASGSLQGDTAPMADSENLLEQQSGLNVRA